MQWPTAQKVVIAYFRHPCPPLNYQAARAGVKAGDIVIRVQGERVVEAKTTEIAAMLVAVSATANAAPYILAAEHRGREAVSVPAPTPRGDIAGETAPLTQL